MIFLQSFALLTAIFLLQGCAPKFKEPGNVHAEPSLSEATFVTFDGTALPLKIWLPTGTPRAIFIALHGYNDYSNFISNSATYFNEQGIGIYAYDQRGFGMAPHRGWWPGSEAMCKDLRSIITLVKNRHPDTPLYLLGDSMGGAVIIVADSLGVPLPCDGVILVAPAVWSRNTMPFYQRWLLWLAARIVPGVLLTGEKLDITPSDNREMLLALGRDPLVIKKSRVDAIYGLVNLMDAAYMEAYRFDQNVLFLYGIKDEIIPAKPMVEIFRQRIGRNYSNPQRLLVYKNGYHMLLRDLQEKVVWNDIVHWLNSPDSLFPSVQEKTAYEITSAEDIDTLIMH